MRNEIRILASLAHPNIVAYYGSFVEDSVLNVVMEYADGGSLFHYIQKARQPLPEAQVLDWFAQMVAALRHMQSKKVRICILSPLPEGWPRGCQSLQIGIVIGL